MDDTVQIPRIQVSDNGHFLVTETGAPFFWLGDTVWEMFHRFDRKEIDFYLSNRQAKRFTVIQAVLLAEMDGLHTPNRYGEKPLLDDDPARPNEAYFGWVDEIIRLAASYGLYIGLLPTWGDKVNHQWGVGPVVFDERLAWVYGRYLGERYRGQTNILWVLGGDRAPEIEGHDYRSIWRAMADGIDEGAGKKVFKTYHPCGGFSTSRWLHDETWLDMNMMQSGHGSGHDTPVWEMIARDYSLSPAKPTLDGEPNYEDHPVNPWPKWDPASGYFRDHDVRKQTYRSVFAGGCGVTYGHHAIWQHFDSLQKPINHPDRTWREALDRPAAFQMQHLRSLMESRPYLTRIPDQELLAMDAGDGGEHIQATRDSNGSYAMLYLPVSRTVSVYMDRLAGKQVKVSWYDPRDGGWIPVGEYPARGAASFTPPISGPDWVLVLDAAD